MTSISKKVYIDKLDDIVNEYNNTYHRKIKMKPIDVKDNTYINIDKEVHDKDSKFEVGDQLGHQNTKKNLLKVILQICLKKFLRLNKLKIQFHGLMLLIILMVKKFLEHSMKKNCKRQFNKNLE